VKVINQSTNKLAATARIFSLSLLFSYKYKQPGNSKKKKKKRKGKKKYEKFCSERSDEMSTQ